MSGNSHVNLQNERQFSKMDSNTESAYISITVLSSYLRLIQKK